MKLDTIIVDKVWGKRILPAPFRNDGDEPVGEIWFDPPAELNRVLVKYLFTSEKLSVQVHPSDAQAGTGMAGKEECWLVLDAEPGARLAIGFDTALDKDAMRSAALDGSIEDLLTWHPVKRGDFFYLPAGTVHAIGPGLTLVEVQQNSDITYRLYDYGRPRELHLDEGLAVAHGAPYAAHLKQHVGPSDSVTLVDGPYFRFSHCDGKPDAAQCAAHPGPLLVLPLEGETVIAGEFLAAGECGLAERIEDVVFDEGGRTLLVSQL
ncbi:MAG: class I mannose-6-phosphate isomerase [Sphingomonadaceae bacterium]